MTPETTEATETAADTAAGGAGREEGPGPGLLSAVWQAVRGTHTNYDYTEGPIGRAIMLLAVPMVMEMLMESVFVVADIFFVSKLGPGAVAAVGLTESLLTIVYTLALGLGIGATATVARRIGEKDAEGAAHVAAQVLVLGVVVSIMLGAAGIAFAPQLLGLMGASAEVVASGSGYTRVMLGGCASVVMLFLVNAVFRGAGDAAIAMRSLWLANAINIVLAPCLIFGVGPFPELGVVGAAVGTTIGRATGALYGISRLFRAGSRLRLRRAQLGLDAGVMRRLLRLSSSAMFQVFVGMASWIGLVRILSGFGDQALAGYVIGVRVILFALFPSWGLGNAAATMVGQALGAGKPERAERAVWLAGFYNVCFLGAVGLVFVLFAGTIVGFFTTDPVVLSYGSDCLRVVAAGFLFYAYGMVLTQSFNGAGDTRTPTIINLFVFWLWEIPLAYVLAYRAGFGPRGVFVAITVAFSTQALVSALIFRRGRWKTREV
jgi:putative MATE family efflux protein